MAIHMIFFGCSVQAFQIATPQLSPNFRNKSPVFHDVFIISFPYQFLPFMTFEIFTIYILLVVFWSMDLREIFVCLPV